MNDFIGNTVNDGIFEVGEGAIEYGHLIVTGAIGRIDQVKGLLIFRRCTGAKIWSWRNGIIGTNMFHVKQIPCTEVEKAHETGV